jgi:hypothetical protein
MILDSYTFEKQPMGLDVLVEEVKFNSSVLTYSDVAYFDWGHSIKGVQLPLRWDYMSPAMYTNLQAKYVATGPLVFDPQIVGLSITYDVQVLSLTGKYFLTMNSSRQHGVALRKDVVLVLLIMGVH